MAMVFQDPMTSLNPVMKIGNQITEVLRQHLDITKDYSNELALALLQSVGIPEAERRLKEYPHQMSGGMRQRVVIAIAIACGPKLLFADEPTTALDVTVQAQILDLLQEQQRERFMAMILVTHDLGVVAGRADDIAVMYAGRIVEKAPTRTLVPGDVAPVHRSAHALDPEARGTEPHPAHRDRRPAAGHHQPADRLQVLAALPVRATEVHDRGTAPAGRPANRATRSGAGIRSAPPRAGPRSKPTSRPGSSPPSRWEPSDGRQRYRTPPTRRRVAAADREPRRRVPGRSQRAEGQRGLERQHRRAAG